MLVLVLLATITNVYCTGGDGDPEMLFGQTYEGFMAPLGEHDYWNLYVSEPGTVEIIMEVEPGLQGEILLFDPDYPNSFPHEAHAPIGSQVNFSTHISSPGWCDITVEYLNYDLDVIDDPNAEYRYVITPTFVYPKLVG